jgi:hypothetical protein
LEGEEEVEERRLESSSGRPGPDEFFSVDAGLRGGAKVPEWVGQRTLPASARDNHVVIESCYFLWAKGARFRRVVLAQIGQKQGERGMVGEFDGAVSVRTSSPVVLLASGGYGVVEALPSGRHLWLAVSG